jgi:[protein-PII] uridylyltransferase
VLTGGFSEVNRAQRVAIAQAELKRALTDWQAGEIDAHGALLSGLLAHDLPQKIEHARFVRDARLPAIARHHRELRYRGSVTELTVFAPDHPWLLSIIAGACAMAGANIVDAQIFTTTDGRTDTIALTREFEHEEDERRRAARVADTIEKALTGAIKIDMMANRPPPKGRIKAFAIEPEVTINNNWSNRYTMVEVTGLDRPGLLFELTATLSKLNLNIASAHVATFGERVVDVFYVTDLLGAKITAATRQARSSVR